MSPRIRESGDVPRALELLRTVFPDRAIALPLGLLSVCLAFLYSATRTSHHLAMWLRTGQIYIKRVLAAHSRRHRPVLSPLVYNDCRSFNSHSSSSGMGNPESESSDHARRCSGCTELPFNVQTNRGYVVVSLVDQELHLGCRSLAQVQLDHVRLRVSTNRQKYSVLHHLSASIQNHDAGFPRDRARRCR